VHIQVISIIDNRLLIEKKLKEDPVSRSVDNNSDLSELQNEYEERFDMILREIDSKEIVIKLQAYTMDVNKILVEEHTANKIILERRRSFTTRFLNRWITRTSTNGYGGGEQHRKVERVQGNQQRITDRT
jgi:hypothetical protein